MTPPPFRNAVGRWVGDNKLWMDPRKPPELSPMTASLRLVAQGRFAELSYTWRKGNEPQDGVMLIGFGPEQGSCYASWVDSFHQSESLMPCKGTFGAEELSLSGSYSAPSGPDWGWRISLACGAEQLRLRMYNIPPGHPEELAVDAQLARSPE